jgi:hypothetical protein
MDTAYLVLTVVLSAIAAGCSTYYLNVSKDRLWFKHRKAEELYCTVQSLDRELSSFFGTRYSLMGDNTPSSGPEKEALRRAGEHLVTAKMLIGFYFPSISSALARTIAAVASAHQSLKALEAAHTEDRQKLLAVLDNAVVMLKDALEGLEASIIDIDRPEATRGSPMLFRRPTKQINAGRILRVAA